MTQRKLWDLFLAFAAIFLVLFAGCVKQQRPLYENFELAERAFDRVSLKRLTTGDRVLLLSAGSVLTDGQSSGQPNSYKLHQHIRHGAMASLSRRRIRLIDPNTSFEFKISENQMEVLPFTNPILQGNWESLKTTYGFDKVIYYKVESFKEFGGAEKTGRGIVIFIEILDKDGVILDSQMIKNFSGRVTSRQEKDILAPFWVHREFEKAIYRHLKQKRLAFRRALLVYYDARLLFQNRSRPVLPGFIPPTAQARSQVPLTALGDIPEEVHLAEKGLITGITRYASSSLREKLDRIYLKRPWMYRQQVFNVTPILLKFGWKHLAQETKADIVVAYRFLATSTEIRTFFRSIRTNSGEPNTNLPLLVKLIDLRKNGLILSSDTLLLGGGENPSAATDEHIVFARGSSLARQIAPRVQKFVKQTDRIALVNMDYLSTGRISRIAYQARLDALALALEDGLISGLSGTLTSGIAEKGIGFFLRKKDGYNQHLDINPINSIDDEILQKEGLTHLLFYYRPDAVGFKPGTDQNRSDALVGTDVGFKLVDLRKGQVVDAFFINATDQ